jgi:type IV secretion system protein VirB1
MIAPALLAGLILRCAPNVDVRTAASVIAVESGGQLYAINDNDTRRAYFPASLDSAKALLGRLAGHQLAVGIAQVDSANFARFGIGAADALDPCTNLRLGAQVLLEDYRRAYAGATGATEEERRQVALRRALSLYNSGSPTAARAYASLVVAATSSPLVRRATAIADAAAARPPEGEALVSREPPKPSPRRPARLAARASSVFAGAPSRVAGSAFVEADR